MRNRSRLTLLGLVVALCVTAAVAYVGISVARSDQSDADSSTRVVSAAALGPQAAPIKTTAASSVDSGGGAKLLFVSMVPDRTSGSLAVAPASDPTSIRAISRLRCERVHYAGGRGICLARRGAEESSYAVAKIFDSRFHVERRISMPGIPSRARVSPDGRYGALTMYLPGDEDTDETFSTRTSIVDLETGKTVADLARIPVTKDGKPFSTEDLNFSGVSFANDDLFYASLGSESSAHLLEGSMRDRTLKVIADNVDSPSLSPDGTRLAFKRTVGNEGAWRLFVLDLPTKKAVRLAGDDPIDDQAEWLDDDHVVYGNDNKLLVVPADGSGEPRLLLPYAFSPAVSRAS
jgi:hypothetical protein